MSVRDDGEDEVSAFDQAVANVGKNNITDQFGMSNSLGITIKGHTNLITQTVEQLTKQVDAIRTHEKQQVVALMENDLSQRNLNFAILRTSPTKRRDRST